MRQTVITSSLLALLACLLSSPASAQYRVWLSNAGNDANPCTVASPCRSLLGALPKVLRNGVIGCLDAVDGISGNRAEGPTITQSVTVDCEGTGAKGGVVPIVINAGPNDVVHFRGINFSGPAVVYSDFFNFIGSGGLVIENCSIQHFNSGNALAINFQPTGVATLDIIDSVITNNGTTVNGGGIRVAPQSGGFARATLRNVNVSKNYVGIAAIGNGSNASVEILNSTISHNRGIGLVAVGAGAVIRVGGSQIVGNAAAATSGNVLSYQNNQIVGNNPDTFPPSAGALR